MAREPKPDQARPGGPEPGRGEAAADAAPAGQRHGPEQGEDRGARFAPDEPARSRPAQVVPMLDVSLRLRSAVGLALPR